jgi:hypothetical protein
MWASTLILSILVLIDLMVIFILGASVSQGRGFDWNMLLITFFLNVVGAYVWRKSRE